MGILIFQDIWALPYSEVSGHQQKWPQPSILLRVLLWSSKHHSFKISAFRIFFRLQLIQSIFLESYVKELAHLCTCKCWTLLKHDHDFLGYSWEKIIQGRFRLQYLSSVTYISDIFMVDSSKKMDSIMKIIAFPHFF